MQRRVYTAVCASITDSSLRYCSPGVTRRVALYPEVRKADRRATLSPKAEGLSPLTQSGVRTFLPPRLLGASDHPAHPPFSLYSRRARISRLLLRITFAAPQTPLESLSDCANFKRRHRISIGFSAPAGAGMTERRNAPRRFIWWATFR